MADAKKSIEIWLKAFDAALQGNDSTTAAALFADECFWRDMVAFTWNIHTCEARPKIETMLSATLDETKPANWRIDGEARESEGYTEAWLAFETKTGPGKGHVRIKDGKCFTFLTTLRELRDFPFQTGRQRVLGVEHGNAKGRKLHEDLRADEVAEIGHSTQPYCLIIGGGQGGMALASRLKYLGVPYLVVEKNKKAGDSWRNRYPSLCLHDPVWYDHMPYIPFPDGWPVFTPKDMMGNWLEMFACVMELNYWTNSLCETATYDENTKRWTVTINRDGEAVTLSPHHIVFATGMSGYPNIPDFPGAKQFSGRQLHSSEYRGGKEFAGKKCVVIGSNTSAHDICADLWENDCAVTMIQRSGTLVVQTETVLEHVVGPLYSENALDAGIGTETGDYMATTCPHRVLERRQVANCAAMRAKDAALHARLEDAGFILDFGPDNTGLVGKSFREGGGFYIDVGASGLICNGEIKLKSGVQIRQILPDGLELDDGTILDADVIVYATGYGSMNRFVADIAGQDIADKVGKCWGLGAGTLKDPGPWEGELRNMWKPTQQEGLWFQGGNLAQSRHYSRFLALQIKARMEGVATPVYARAPSHHTS